MSRPAGMRAAALLLFLVAAGTASAATLRLDAGAAWRSLNDAKIRQTYGTAVSVPFGFDLVFRSGWEAGLHFEWSPTRAGTLGLSDSAARFHLLGLEAAVGREFRLGLFGLYVRAGAGLYHYKQTVTYAYVQDYKVDRFAPAAVIAAGVRGYPWRFLYVSADAKYVVLSVKPYGVAVDLGGWRLGGSLGFVFK
ncbi:MAG: hypothetical protein PHI34_13550 [Acidobacteriota bacterium]|nr:hypothetical protein [Acidobacteriota bacterium]